jgi:hypothetical protein
LQLVRQLRRHLPVQPRPVRRQSVPCPATSRHGQDHDQAPPENASAQHDATLRQGHMPTQAAQRATGPDADGQRQPDKRPHVTGAIASRQGQHCVRRRPRRLAVDGVARGLYTSLMCVGPGCEKRKREIERRRARALAERGPQPPSPAAQRGTVELQRFALRASLRSSIVPATPAAGSLQPLAVARNTPHVQ